LNPSKKKSGFEKVHNFTPILEPSIKIEHISGDVGFGRSLFG
jgi:hypothetical protein